MPLLEVCVDSVESARAAQSGGAERLELCSSLAEGGVTPSHGLVRQVCAAVDQASCPVHVLVRPRPGDFVYTEAEIEVIRQDVVHAASLGAAGVVLGVLTPQGRVHLDQLRPLMELTHALGLDLTFHRAFDCVADQPAALSDLVGAGVRRVLTSGGRPAVMQGLAQIADLVEKSDGRITVMAGGGLTAENIATVARATGVPELHGTFRRLLPSNSHWAHAVRLFRTLDSEEGGGGWERYSCDAEFVRRARAALAQGDDMAAEAEGS